MVGNISILANMCFKLIFIQGFGPYYVDPPSTINYFPNFPNNPPPISLRSMFGRQQLPSELNRQNSVLLDLQELLAEIVDGPKGNLRQRRRTVRQQGDGVQR